MGWCGYFELYTSTTINHLSTMLKATIHLTVFEMKSTNWCPLRLYHFLWDGSSQLVYYCWWESLKIHLYKYLNCIDKKEQNNYLSCFCWLLIATVDNSEALSIPECNKFCTTWRCYEIGQLHNILKTSISVLWSWFIPHLSSPLLVFFCPSSVHPDLYVTQSIHF